MNVDGRPAKAQYLLRIDDLCPTMRRDAWQRITSLVERHEIRPLLAVIPDNRDAEFLVEEADCGFWAQMRRFQAAGAAIGLHGYQHLCHARGRSLVPLHGETEFAGASEELQREWIGQGAGILGCEGLKATVWVAPRHGFDRATLGVLAEQGIGVISDGFARKPTRWLGMTWIPQQLWLPRERESGLWTICLHPGSIGKREIDELEQFFDRHAAEFTSVERVLREWPVEERSLEDRTEHWRTILRIRAAKIRRKIGVL